MINSLMCCGKAANNNWWHILYISYYINQYNKMEIQPRLKTIEMVKKTIRNHDRKYSYYQLWKKLPKKMMYQTYKTALGHLMKNKSIMLNGNGKLSWIKQTEEKTIMWSRDNILWNLSYYGYDLIALKKTKKPKIMLIEDLIIAIAIKYPEARFIEGIPFLMLKNKIDIFELYRKSYELCIINKLGFLLEIALMISKKQKIKTLNLKQLLQQCQKMKSKKSDSFSTFKNTALMRKNTPKLMKQWNLIGRFQFEDFYKEEYL